jgi:hypothetical protein
LADVALAITHADQPSNQTNRTKNQRVLKATTQVLLKLVLKLMLTLSALHDIACYWMAKDLNCNFLAMWMVFLYR